MDYKKIDPALELMKDFGKITGGIPGLIDQMRQKSIFSESNVPQKFKILTAVVWAISARCEPCFKYYIHHAIKTGATEAELGEFLAIASTMGGCVGEMWALKAYKAFKEYSGDSSSNEAPSCCD
ncbi:MAG: carboxymuconolactone decarboxylase family protein [Bdellovibrionales bacterium CG10_big_fil_rev_8_21_14_0_10_45_34]|nr:MAG: carboxymuconolactone decarboxylase family protein [Bdellovibrionales bacterium CG10_big_fil_rev_8_21_14_0_10_45_34]